MRSLTRVSPRSRAPARARAPRRSTESALARRLSAGLTPRVARHHPINCFFRTVVHVGASSAERGRES
jgi:hypothetical protein